MFGFERSNGRYLSIVLVFLEEIIAEMERLEKR